MAAVSYKNMEIGTDAPVFLWDFGHENTSNIDFNRRLMHHCLIKQFHFANLINSNCSVFVYAGQEEVTGLIRIYERLPNYKQHFHTFESIAQRFRDCVYENNTISYPLIIEALPLNLSEKGFDIENDIEVRAFINSNPGVEVILDEINSEVSKYLDSFKIQLSFFKDEEEGTEVLNFVVKSDKDFASLMESEFSIFENWFKKYYNKFPGKINFRVYPL